MTFKNNVKMCIVFCIAAILSVALCGCDDLGAYSDPAEYYDTFGDIVLIDRKTGGEEGYSMEEFFYSKASRETFLMEDGVYKGVAHGEYVYMAIPLERTIDMDTLALYLQATNDVTVYIDVYITAVIPPVLDEEGAPFVPDSTAGVGEIVVHLAANKWNSFILFFSFIFV